MMRAAVLLFSALLPAVFLFPGTNMETVSLKKEAAIFPAYVEPFVTSAPYNAASLVDDKVRSVLGGMKRFVLVPYPYAWDGASVSSFIDTLSKLRAKGILADEKYYDADLGAVVIPGSAVERIIASSYIFIPSITSYSELETNRIELKEEKDGVTNTNWVREYTASASIQVRVLDGNGVQVERFSGSREEKSESSMSEASRTALTGCANGLDYQIRLSEAFRLRSQVISRDGGSVRMELGSDIGVLPGWEFKWIDNGLSAGFVRVRDTASETSVATAVLGNPLPGAALWEAPMNGFRILLSGGVRYRPAVEIDRLVLTSLNGWVSTNSYSIGTLPVMPSIALKMESEVGYSGVLVAGLTAVLQLPFEITFSAGYKNEFYFGPWVLGFALEAVAGVAGTFDSRFEPASPVVFAGRASNLTFTRPFDAGASLLEAGVRPGLELSAVLSQGSRVRAFGSFEWLPLRYASMTLSGTGADSNVTATLPLRESGTAARFIGASFSSGDFPMLPWNASAGLEWIGRF